MLRKIAALAAVALLLVMFLPLVRDVPETAALGRTAEAYARTGVEETGSANLVTAIVVSYRGLDTLGEVTVLFLATAGISFLLRREGPRKGSRRGPRDVPAGASELLVTGSILLFPLLLLFGVYIFVHGHLGPGGGFQGGVVIASAVLLLLLADPQRKISHGLLTWIESLSGLFFAGIGIAGLVLAGGFLDNRILPLGIPGELFSAGAIPLIYSLVGLKVGSELAGILDALRKEEEE
jgi:multicomponent Na+:H+ antiporter subunit B